MLDGGLQFTHAELLRHTRLCHAITYASCQGLTPPGLRSAWHQRSSCTGRGTQKKGCTPGFKEGCPPPATHPDLNHKSFRVRGLPELPVPLQS